MATTSYGNVTINTSASLIIAANNRRKSFVVYNNGSNDIFIGLDANVTSSNGIPIRSLDSWTQNGIIWTGNIYGITSVGSSDIRYWDIGQ